MAWPVSSQAVRHDPRRVARPDPLPGPGPGTRRTRRHPLAAAMSRQMRAVAGMLDDAFAALDRAFTDSLVVSKARLSKEKEFEVLRKDPRWEDFWKRRVEDR